MRIETVECHSRAEAERQCPWACRIVKLYTINKPSANHVGWYGWKCFENATDYKPGLSKDEVNHAGY